MFNKPLPRGATPLGRVAKREQEALKASLEWLLTLDDAEWFLARLDATPNWWGELKPCQRATEARRWLQKPVWSDSPDHIRIAIVSQRSIICACHETHSFAPTAESGGARPGSKRVLSCLIPGTVTWHAAEAVKED